MSGHEPHIAEHGLAEGQAGADGANPEKAVADAIERAIDVPASIEEQQLLDAAELEELESGS
jgi:hypothetical protein